MNIFKTFSCGVKTGKKEKPAFHRSQKRGRLLVLVLVSSHHQALFKSKNAYPL